MGSCLFRLDAAAVNLTSTDVVMAISIVAIEMDRAIGIGEICPAWVLGQKRANSIGASTLAVGGVCVEGDGRRDSIQVRFVDIVVGEPNAVVTNILGRHGQATSSTTIEV